MSPISSNDKGPKNRAAIYIVGIIGALVVVGLCIMGVWILLSQGIISLPLINKPLISSTPLFSPTPIYSSTPTPSPIPLPTATQALFSKPVSYLIPRVSDLPNTFDIDTENQAVQLIKKSMNLPSEYQDIIAFKDNSSSTKPLYGPHDGTPLTATIWITIFPTIGGGEEYMRKINTSDSINSMMNVINPTALLDVNPSPALKITSPETACDEINVYKSYELVLTDAVSVSANCRIINVVIIFWSLTNDNYDGQGAHIPDSLLNQQTVSFLSLVMEKIK